MEKRGRGGKLPNNFVKTAILIYLTDWQRSASEIRDYLKLVHNIKEPRGVRLHLAKLYDEGYLEKKGRKRSWKLLYVERNCGIISKDSKFLIY